MNNTEVKPKFDANLPFKEAQAKPKFDASKPFIPTEEVETKPVQVNKERYDELQKSYSALDETFKDLKNTLGDLAKPFHPANVDNTYRDKALGVDIPLISKPTTPEASEEKHDDPYKALLGVNAKQFNIKDADLNKTSPAYSANQQKLNTAYLNDLDQVKKMNQKQLVDFVNQKKAFLNQKKEEEIAEARRKAGAGTINLFGVDFGVYKPTLDMFLGGKADNSLEEINIKSEYANLEVGLDNIAKLGAFEKAPEMYKNIDQTLKMSREQIIKNLQKTGNNIQNITDESAKATFNAYGEAGYENAKYPQLYKDKLAYTGYQSEVNAATNEIGAISKNISDKLKQIDDLSEQLKKDPTNESIINNIQKLSLEIKPLRTEIEKRKNFISKLSDASLELSEYAKEYEKQAIEDKRDAELMQEFGAIVGRSTVIAGKQLSNELISTLKASGLIGLELSKSLGRNPSQAEIMKRGILDTDVSFTIPSRIKYGKPVEVSFEEGETLPDIKVNWDLVAPMAIKTTAEMMLMQGAAGPFAEFGTVGKLAGLFAGSSMVFGGDTFLQELEKGASIKEAAAITSARMLIEAGTEMINPLEFINYEKAGRKFFGNTLSKTDFIRYVGSNWKTLLPKLKAQGVDVLSFLGNFGKSVGFESLEEVMSDLGNYGLDKFIVENIKPDYKQENQFTLENEITTALTTALTMPLMSGYQAWHETKASKYIPGLLWRASQNSETFLKNLNDNFKKGNITEEFFKTGVKEVETVSNLYKTNKGKIDVAPEDEKVEYLDALYQHNKISEQFLAETDLTKKEELAKQVETALKKVQKFDKEYAPLVGNPQAQKSKAEERYIENIKSFATPESVKTASIEDLNKAKEVFADVIKDPFSPTVAAEAQKHIDLIDAEIKLREEKAKQPVAEPEPTDLDLDNKTYASKVLKLSDEEIEDLDASGELEDLVTKDKKPKIKTAELTKRFEEAKLLQGEEKIDRLAEISLEAAKEGLFDLYKQIDAFKTAENKVTIGTVEFPVGSKVTYDNQEWEVVSVDGVGKLVQGKKTVVPSDPENIKVTKFISAEGLLEEEPEVTPTDIEAKKADIEKRRQEEYEKQRAEEKQYEEENTDEGSSEVQEDIGDVSAETTGENPVEENTPETGTEEARDEAKENKKQLDNPINPFRNTFDQRSQKDKDINAYIFSLVAEKLFNLVKTKDLAKEGFYISVVPSQQIPWEQLSERVQKHFGANDSEKRINDTGKYLVITDKEGKPHKFSVDGELLTDGTGSYATSVFPNTKSETELTDAKFDRTNKELEKQGKTRQWFLDQVKRIFQARKANKVITYRIGNVHQGGYEINVETPISIKQSLKGKQAEVNVAQNGKVYFTIKGETTPNEVNRPRFTKRQIDTILHIISNKGVNKTDTQERQQFVTKLIGEKFFRVVDGKKVELAFKFDKGLIIPQARNEGEVDFRTLTNEEFRDILSKITPNINKMLLETNAPFNYYDYNGKTVSKKVYSYSDFIVDNFDTYNNVSSTEVKPEYFVEVGDPVDSYSNEIIENSEKPAKPEPIVEKKEKVKTTITKESPTEKKPTKRKRYDVDESDPFKDFLKRAKKLITEVTAEQEKEAEEWFKNSPLARHINFRDFRKYTNSDAWATWKSSSTTLWKGGKFTDLYHEAWHEFTQLYLTKEQKTALYNEAMQTKQGKQAIEDYAKEINKSVSELTDLERYFAVEEMVAEDFFKYALAKKEGKELILDQRPKRNSIFRKIWNYLKEAFTGKVDLQTYYEKLYTGNINKYQRNLDNAFFGSLNKGLDGIVDGEAITLTNAETKNLYQSIDYLFGQIFENPDGRSESIPMTLMFEDNAVVSGIYKKILNTFKAEFNKTADKLDELEPGTPEYEAQERILNNLSFAIQNWNDVVKSHIDHSSFFKISKDAIKFDEDTFIDPTDTSDEEDDKNNDRDSSVVKNENVSSKEAASNETIYLIATLSTKNRNPLLPMFNLPVDFKQTWDILTKNLQGTLEYPELYSKIDKLKDKYDWAESLLKRLPDPKKEVLTEAEQRLKASFLIDIGKPKVDTHEISVNSNGEFYYTKSAATDESKVKQNWNTNFANLTPEKSQFVKYDSTQNTYLDVKELVEDFKSAFPSIKKTYEGLDKGKLFTDRIAFLSNLGIVFSEETQSSPEFINFITSFKGPIYDIFRLVDLLKSQKPQSTNPIKDLGNVKVEGDIKYFSRVFPLLLKKELEFSEQFITQSVKNAANNTVWQIRDWNYISKIYNALNDVEKYPTYQSLINEPWLKQFDTNTNPYVNGITLNSIFDLKTGERRKGGNGNYVKVELHDYNGLVLNLGTGVKNEGKTTTDLTDFEKLVQNFNTLLLYGVQEHLRYGDKSSSFATKLSHIWNPITKQLEDRKNAPIVPIDKFSIDDDSINYLPDQLYSHLAIALRGELIPMKLNHEQGIGDNWKFYKDNIKDLGIFEGILTKPTIDILKKEYVGTEGADVNEVLKKNQAQIRKDIQVYLKSQKQVLDKKLSNNLLQKSDFVSASLLKKAGIDQLKAAYVANSLLYNIEHTKTVTGDPRFYKSDGGKKDPFKRFSAFSATGRIFLTDEQTNKFLENKVNAIKDAVAKKLGVIIPPKDTKGMIRSVIFKDAKYNSKALRKEYTEYFLSKGYSQERIDEILEKYKGITEADGQGWMTLDEYKQSKLRSGSSHWTKAHEEAYQKEAAFLRGERIQGMSLEELALFVPQKWQYAGTAIDGEYTLPVFYKFSVAPLIPSMIKGKSFEQIHDNLIKQNVGLALFESGSKISGIMNPEGGFNQFYSDYEKRTPFEGEYTINPIFYNYLKEQVNIDPELKGKVTFSSQMRKLLHINLFKEGKALIPKAEELEKRFGDAIEKLVSLEKERVISQMGATLKDGKWTFDAKKLQKFFVKEFEERGLPDEVIDYFQVGENGQFTYPLDASNRRDKIEKIIYSIANKRLVQQKINGEALIQLAATGFELNSDKLKDVIEDAGLPFYRVVNGKTQAMKVKIAFSEKWKPLLKLNHPDGKVIRTVERLNEAIRDDKWVKEHYKKITIVGVRIPVQGLNSQEFMEVYEFLPPSAGPVIIVSPYLVAKSGGDFDIDKLTTFFPSLDDNGDLYTTTSEEEIKKKYDSLLKEYKKAVGQGKDEAVDKVIAAIFGVSPKKLEKERKQELAEEIFGEDQVPSFDKFRAFNLKKAYQNQIIDIMRQTLELEENFEQLISPNSTDLLEESAKILKELEEDKPKGTWTELVEFAEIGRQFKSNLVGKSNLGIAAVWNTFFALAQRGGLTLNKTYEKDFPYTTSEGDQAIFHAEIPVRINMPHNETSDGGVSLSSLMDVEGKHKISKIFEQAINGFVDVAKDDWIFYINGVKEIVPTMLFTAAAGVNNKNMIAFFNQPVIKQYVKELQQYKSLFVKFSDPDLYKDATKRAKENLVLQIGKDLTVPEFKTEFEKIFKKPEKRNTEINKFIRFVQSKAEENKQLFTTEKLSESVFNGKVFSAEEKLMVLTHFFELQSLAQEVSNLQRSLNSDTKKAADSSFIYDRRQKLKEAYKTGLFPKEAMERMFNNSTIKAFTNTKTGFDAFVGELFKELLEITNHPVFNETIVQLAKDDSELLYENKVVKPEKFRKTLKNDFISYLYQNNVFSEDDLNTVAKVVSKLFKPKTALANELTYLKSKYPNLVENYPILSQLVGDRKPSKEKESNKSGLVNIKLKSKLSDRDELNSAVNQIRQLLQFNDLDFTKEEQLEIQNFAKKFVQFAIIQSGLNSSIYDLMDLVPNEEYTKGIAPFVNAFKEMLDTNPTLAKKEIQKFYNMRFKQQNPSFYKFKEFPQNINSTNIRGKNFIVSSAYDFTGKKKIAADLKKAEYIETLPSKTTTSPNTNSATIKNNPTSLVLVENNAKLTATQGLKESNFASIITKEAIGKPLLDANLPQNQELIDKFIKEIIDKSEDFTNIVFNEKGYGQHLLPENKRTFDYLSDQLYTYFGFQNPGYTPVAPREVIQPTAPEAITTVTTEVIEQPIQNKEGFKKFVEQPINKEIKEEFVNHSGGAIGSDTEWDIIGSEFGMINNKHYWTETKTPKGNTEISKQDFEEGRFESAKAAKRNFGYQYSAMKDSRLIRNWSQVKHSESVFAIGSIVKVGEKLFPNQKLDTRTAVNPSVTGGTGYAVGMAINNNKPVYVFNQTKGSYDIGWYKYDKNINDFIKVETPVLTKNFAGIGTREINEEGKQAIRNVYEKTFNKTQEQPIVEEKPLENPDYDPNNDPTCPF